MVNYSCGTTHQVYKNGTGTAKDVRVTVANKCGEHTTIIVVDLNGDLVNDALLSPPGGVVTMTVGANQRLRVLCVGSQNSNDGCQVDLAFP